MNLRQKTIKGIFWSVIQSWGRQTIALVVFSLLARLLEPETFGLIALASVFLAFIDVFIDQGFSTAIVQRQEIEPEHLDTAFWTNILIGILMAIFSIAVASLVANFFKQPELTPIIRWLSLTFIVRALSAVQESIFKRNLAFKALAMRSLFSVVVGGTVGVTMAFAGFGVWSLVGQQLVSGLVQILVLWWASDWRPGFKISRKHFRELFSFGINIVGINILLFFNKRTDDFLIGYFIGPTALGYYNIAYRILLIMSLLLGNVIAQVALPAFSKLQQEPEQLRRAFYKATQLTSIISLPAFFATTLLAPEIVPVLFGPQWMPSVPVMQILSFVGIVNSVGSFTGTVITACGKPSWNLMLGLINTPLNLIGFSIAVHWGIAAVALAFSIRGYLFLPLPLLVVRKLIDIKFTTYFSKYMVSLVGLIMMSATILGIKYFLKDYLSTAILLSVCITFGFLVYITTIWLLAPQIIQQILEIARLKKNKIK